MFLSWRTSMTALLLLGLFVLAMPVSAADLVKIRIGILKFGTVSWELQVIQELGLANQEGVELEVIPLAMKNATTVALQGGAVDIIVNDWIWVSRQRAAGRDYTFVPYSLAVGSLMVRPDADIDTLADLRGQRVGVAGGPVDKSWLLLRAYSKKMLDKDLTELVEPNFAASPLLNELMLNGQLPAVLNFWHYGARLKAAGMRELITVEDILSALGVEQDIPLIGWVFEESWAERHREAIQGFLDASRQAKRLMAESDELWDRIRPHMRAEDDATFIALRDAYRAGIPKHFGEREMAAARRVFQILAEEGGEALVGRDRTLAAGTFWSGYAF